MRAGRLTARISVINNVPREPDQYGQVLTLGNAQWRDLPAEVVQIGAQQFLRDAGPATVGNIIFRTRYYLFLLDAGPCLVSYGGSAYRLVEVKAIGRNEGLELRCVREESSRG